MRYSSTHKEESRREIVDMASRRLRSDGIAAVGVRALMTDAGLTHGAFYGHFGSKADLVAEAVFEALDRTREAMAAEVAAAPPNEKIETLVGFYLRPLHRDRPDRGCAAATLTPEIVRLEPDVRKRFWEGVEGLVALIETLLPAGGSPAERSGRAFAVFASMIGTLQLSRAVADEDISKSILASGRGAAIATAKGAWQEDRDGAAIA